MESPGSFCWCRFQHLLSKEWEALGKTAKDVSFPPQGPSSRGHGVSIIAEISPGNGRRQPCPEGERNERHMGPRSQDRLGSAPTEGRGLLHLQTAKGTPSGRRAASLRKNAGNSTSQWLWCPVLAFGTRSSAAQAFPAQDQASDAEEIQTPAQTQH